METHCFEQSQGSARENPLVREDTSLRQIKLVTRVTRPCSGVDHVTGEWSHHSCFLWRHLSGQTVTDGQAFLFLLAVLQNYFVLGGDPPSRKPQIIDEDVCEPHWKFWDKHHH